MNSASSAKTITVKPKSSRHSRKSVPATESQGLKMPRPNQITFLCGTCFIFEGYMERQDYYVLTSRPKHKPGDLLPVNLRPGQLRSWLFSAWATGQKGWTPKSKCRPPTCKTKVSITSHFSGHHFSLQRWCQLKSWHSRAWKQLAPSQTHHTGGLTSWFLGLGAPTLHCPIGSSPAARGVSRQQQCRPSGPISQQCTCLLTKWMNETKP